MATTQNTTISSSFTSPSSSTAMDTADGMKIVAPLCDTAGRDHVAPRKDCAQSFYCLFSDDSASDEGVMSDADDAKIPRSLYDAFSAASVVRSPSITSSLAGAGPGGSINPFLSVSPSIISSSALYAANNQPRALPSPAPNIDTDNNRPQSPQPLPSPIPASDKDGVRTIPNAGDTGSNRPPSPQPLPSPAPILTEQKTKEEIARSTKQLKMNAKRRKDWMRIRDVSNEGRRLRYLERKLNPDLRGSVGRPIGQISDEENAVRRERTVARRNDPTRTDGRPRNPDSVHESRNLQKRCAKVKAKSRELVGEFA